MSRAIRNLFAVAVLLSLTLTLSAQSSTSRVTGSVSDPTGAIIPNAKVTLTNENTQVAFTTQTTSSGAFVFESVPSGPYTLAVEAPGFKVYSSKNNVLAVGAVLTVNAKLAVGATGEVVEVDGSAATVETSTSANTGNVVDQATVKALPIVGSRGRNPISFVNFQPGVVTSPDLTGGGVHVHGARDRSWNFTLDGVDINETSAGGSNFSPLRTNPDAVSEFRVITGNPSSEYGRNSGAQVVISTPSGTNGFHGNGFWFYQSPFLQANEVINNTNRVGKQQFVQNIYGGSIGGPIIKNKTFFFVNVQLLHTRRSRILSSTVYTQNARNGLFRYVNGGRNGPAGSANAAVDSSGNPLPGLTISTYNIAANDPAALGLDSTIQSILAMTPLPNDFTTLGDGLNTAAFTWLAPEFEKQVDEVFRIDHSFNQKHSIFGRWSSGHQNTIGDFVNGGQAPFPDAPNVVDTIRIPRNLALNHRWSISPRMTNELIVGMNRFGFDFKNPDPNASTNLPFVLNTVTDPRQNYVGNARYLTTYQLADNFTFVKGQHTYKMGANLRYGRHIDQRGSIGSLNAQLSVNFSTAINAVTYGVAPGNFPTATGINTTTGTGDRDRLSATINNLLGRYGAVSQGFISEVGTDAYAPAGTILRFDFRMPEYDFYFQDSWKARKNLVIDYGMRWEIRLSPRNKHDQILRPDQPFTVGSAPSTNLRWEEGKLYKDDWNNFGPSIGLAWDPWSTGKNVLRANYRIAFDRMNTFALSSGVFQGMPGLTFQSSNTSAGAAGGRLRNGLPSVTPTATPSSLRQPLSSGTLFSGSTSQTVVDPNWEAPKTHMWQLGVEREIARNTIVSLNYVGRHGVSLFGGYDANAVNIFGNGFLDAYNLVKAGGESALINQMLAPHTSKPSGVTGSAWLRTNPSIFPTLSSNSVAGLAAAISQRVQSGTSLLVQAGLPQTFFQAYPQFGGSLNVLDSGDESNYHAFEAQIARRFTSGLSYQLSYTLAKSLDNRSFDPAFTRVGRGAAQSATASPYDNAHRGLNYARSDFDRRHSIQGTWVFELPFGKSGRWGKSSNDFVDRLISGWQYAGVLNISSGRPFTIFSGSNTFSNVVQTPANCLSAGCGDDAGNIRWIGGVPHLFDPVTQRALFTVPDAGALANKGRNAFTLPSFFNTDFSIGKKTRILEGHSIETRLEMQNAFNHVNYSLPESATITAPTFGRSRGASGNSSRKMQLSMKYTF